ncbi:hypothetical protein LCGC14_1963510 [marine sediment metagenome]|uniref:Uncharacterized protein n=1 Tax=marine sediment metagenome TaxID=412755 RepID=A0A0F9IAW8_9ZZZZ
MQQEKEDILPVVNHRHFIASYPNKQLTYYSSGPALGPTQFFFVGVCFCAARGKPGGSGAYPRSRTPVTRLTNKSIPARKLTPVRTPGGLAGGIVQEHDSRRGVAVLRIE